jgi:hypothetical protein
MKFINGFTIDVKKLNKKYKEFYGTFEVPVDKKLCKMMLQQHDMKLKEEQQGLFPDETRDTFQQLVNCISNDKLRVKMNQRFKIGRFYPDTPKKKNDKGKPNEDYKKNFSSLVMLPRCVKNTIFHYGGWTDLDQKKGHPTILVELAYRNQMDLPAYSKFISNFDDIVSEAIDYYSPKEGKKITKTDVKQLFNMTIYGGSHSTWLKNLNEGSYQTLDDKKITDASIAVDVDVKKKPFQFYIDFKKETDVMMDKIYKANKAIQDLVCVGKGYDDPFKDENARKRRVMSYCCGVMENDITYYAYKFLTEKEKLINNGCCDIAFDGVTIPVSSISDEIMREMNDYVRKKTDFKRVEFVSKPFDSVNHEIIEERKKQVIDPYDTSSSEEEEEDEEEDDDEPKLDPKDWCETDLKAARRIMELIGDDMILVGQQIYIKNNHIYISCETLVEKYLSNYIQTSPLYGINGTTLKPYAKYENLNCVKPVVATILNQFGEGAKELDQRLFHTTTKYRLCFRNGVLDFKQRRFFKWDEIKFPYYSTMMINYDYKPVTGYKEKIIDKIIKPLFNGDWELAIKYLSRSVSGCIEDKNWASLLANRNCGKGVLFELLKGAFEDYIQTIAVSLILTNPNKSCEIDDARSRYWMIDYEYTRIAYAQEIPDQNKDQVVRTDFIKKIHSGGDPIQARRNYDRRDTTFTLDVSVMVLGNSYLKSIGDTLQHRFQFSSSTEFISEKQMEDKKADENVSEFELQKYAIADDTIKDKCKTHEYHLMMVAMLFDMWSPEILKVPYSSIDEEEQMTPMKIFNQVCEITFNPNDFVMCQKLHAICGVKIKSELEGLKPPPQMKNGIAIYTKQFPTKNKDKDFDIKGCSVYYGIKALENPTMEDVDLEPKKVQKIASKK